MVVPSFVFAPYFVFGKVRRRRWPMPIWRRGLLLWSTLTGKPAEGFDIRPVPR